MSIANKFTVSRIVFAPIFLVLYFLPSLNANLSSFTGYIMLPLLALAELTDFFDGYYARKHNEVSDFGKVFDPFADVILHMTSFICLTLAGYLSPILLILVFYREFAMNFLRMVSSSKGIVIAARKGGKFKTVLYVVVAVVVLAFESLCRIGVNVEAFASVFNVVVLVLEILTVVASYASFIDYLICFIPKLKEKK